MDTRRAQQFMPFASLKGYYKLIEEKEEEEHIKRELSEESAEDLNYKFSQLKIGAEIKVEYYDVNTYKTAEGILKVIDMTKKIIIVERCVIRFGDIYDIKGDSIISK